MLTISIQYQVNIIFLFYTIFGYNLLNYKLFNLGSSEADLTEDNSDKQSGRNHHGSATLPGGVGLHASTAGAAASRSEDGASECR